MEFNENEMNAFELLDRQFFIHELLGLPVDELDGLYGIILDIFDAVDVKTQIILTDNLKTIQKAIKIVEMVGQIDFNLLMN